MTLLRDKIFWVGLASAAVAYLIYVRLAGQEI